MSGFLSLNTKDFIKGLIVAVLSALFAGVQKICSQTAVERLPQRSNKSFYRLI